MALPVRIPPSAVAALRPVLSVAIAVAAAHALGLHDTWWAAISAFMVMQADFGASAYRGALRVVGTLCGAGLALLLAPPVAHHPLVFVLLMSVAAWAGLFMALVYRYSYAWLLALVTFVMVMCEALGPQTGLGDFALQRIANVVVGTLACIVVAGLTERRLVAALLRREAPAASAAGAAAPQPPSGANVERRDAALHALQGAIAMALLSTVVCIWTLRSFPQGMVTAIAVLVVPLDADAPDPHRSVMQRMAQRFAGCLIAGVLAFALLPLLEGRALWCQLALGLGVWAGALLQAGPVRTRYMAVQFIVAFLMVFVQDRGWTIDAGPALERLGGVFAGVASLAVVLALFRRRPAPCPGSR
jgi:uncharacterized membrane protein YccC